MDSGLQSDTESEVSFHSFGSSHSSCEDNATGLCPSLPIFIDPNNVEEFHSYLRTKHQAILQTLEIKSGVIYFSSMPSSFSDAPQLIKYFTRYGRVIQCRIFRALQHRSRKAGRNEEGPRNAYLEFADSRQAREAVEAVKNSPVYSRLFQCTFLEVNQVPSDAFHEVRSARATTPLLVESPASRGRTSSSRRRKSRAAKIDGRSSSGGESRKRSRSSPHLPQEGATKKPRIYSRR